MRTFLPLFLACLDTRKFPERAMLMPHLNVVLVVSNLRAIELPLLAYVRRMISSSRLSKVQSRILSA